MNMKNPMHKHYEKLNRILLFVKVFSKESPVDIYEIWTNNKEIEKKLSPLGRKLLIEKLFENGFIKKTQFGLGSGREGETGYYISNKGLELLAAGGYIGEKQKKNYSQRQITIAYCVTNELITTENAAKILSTYSDTKSVEKFLTKRIFRVSDLTKLSGNKTTDTKHLNDLKAAKRLISGRKNKKAITDISRIITAFETAYNNRY